MKFQYKYDIRDQHDELYQTRLEKSQKTEKCFFRSLGGGTPGMKI
jgi:hypothetical protein